MDVRAMTSGNVEEYLSANSGKVSIQTSLMKMHSIVPDPEAVAAAFPPSPFSTTSGEAGTRKWKWCWCAYQSTRAGCEQCWGGFILAEPGGGKGSQIKGLGGCCSGPFPDQEDLQHGED